MARIKTPEPTKLYRYRSLHTPKQFDDELSALAGMYLWCSKFSDLNDPMEGTYKLAIKDRPNPRRTEITQQLYDEKCLLGICSFSETNDNAVMWAHYADGFGGICIEYDFHRLKAGLSDRHCFVRMAYSENESELTFKTARANDAAQSVLSYKSHRWLYEREWRLISPQPRQNLLPVGSIISVFLGSRIRENRKKALKRVLGELRIPYREMTIDGYSIDFGASNEHK